MNEPKQSNQSEQPQTIEQLYENKQHAFLFVGRPWDGDWRNIHPDQQSVVAPEFHRPDYSYLSANDEYPRATNFAYHKILVHQRGLQKLYVFAHESLVIGASFELWVRLLNGYRVIK